MLVVIPKRSKEPLGLSCVTLGALLILHDVSRFE
jgi:hypothetical protein